MKQKWTLLAVILFAAFSASADKYVADTNKSVIRWTGKKIAGQHNGTIKLKEGSVEIKNGKPTGGTFIIEMKSLVDVDLTDEKTNQTLVNHLKSDDFFSVEKFPEAKLVITSVKEKAKGQFTFVGDLTIKGITHSIQFEAKVTNTTNTAEAKGQMIFDRTLYNVRYGSGKFFENLGDKIIKDDIILDFDIVATK